MSLGEADVQPVQLIVTNRGTPALADVKAKLFTRDVFGSD